MSRIKYILIRIEEREEKPKYSDLAATRRWFHKWARERGFKIADIPIHPDWGPPQKYWPVIHDIFSRLEREARHAEEVRKLGRKSSYIVE